MPMPTTTGQSRPTAGTDTPAIDTADTAARTRAIRTRASGATRTSTSTSTDTGTRTSDGAGSAATPRRSRWGRFLAAVLPEPSPDRLVPVAEVPRALVPFAEESLADVDLTPVVQELRSAYADTRFVVLVAARDRDVAAEVLAGV